VSPACGYFQVFDRIKRLTCDVRNSPDIFKRIFDCPLRYAGNGLFSIEECCNLSTEFGGVKQFIFRGR
jgi:hypothetical protein